MVVNMHQAKTNLSRLVELAMSGERVVIARNGKELLVLQPLNSPVGRTRVAGSFRGSGHLSEDFDSPLDESILKEFE
jgi:prevent-host-death family protein